MKRSRTREQGRRLLRPGIPNTRARMAYQTRVYASPQPPIQGRQAAARMHLYCHGGRAPVTHGVKIGQQQLDEIYRRRLGYGYGVDNAVVRAAVASVILHQLLHRGGGGAVQYEILRMYVRVDAEISRQG